MCNKITALFAGLFLLSTHVFGQFNDVLEFPVDDNEIVDPMYRTGRVGIGFANFTAYNNAIGSFSPRLLVQEGLLGHYVSGVIGDFSGKWCGLGVGNPGGLVQPYGLAIADNNNVGFYNLLTETVNSINRTNLVAGFGFDGLTNDNRFIIRGYSGSNASVGKDLLIANPGGATGINAEPLSTFWVDATEDQATLFKNIAITDEQKYNGGSTNIQPASSGIGAQANTSLATIASSGK